MATTTNDFMQKIIKDPDWGKFIEPDRELETLQNPNDKYKISVMSGHRALYEMNQSINPSFDKVIKKITEQRDTITFEDQCSAKYYFDIFNVVQAEMNHLTKIVEVGVFMGGSTCILAGAIEDTTIELDLLDLNRVYLYYAYERVRRAFPKTALRVRLFLGDLPTYVNNVLLQEKSTKNMIHHDACHGFNDVVRDLASLSFASDKIHGLMIQDTHLRGGNIDSYLFVDAAVYAVFGDGLKYLEIGSKYMNTTEPAFQFSTHGTYFLGNYSEGMYIPFFPGMFRYPHPSVKIENLLLAV